MSLALLGYAHAAWASAARRSTHLSSLRRLPKLRARLPICVGLHRVRRAHTFEWLEKAREECFTRLAYLRQEAFWEPLRSDPRFTDLLYRIGFPQ